MYVPFEQLPDHARLWIYVADRSLSGNELSTVQEALHSFCEQWDAHGHPLKSSFRIEQQQFLIIAVDEGLNAASGCSIDGSVHTLKTLQETLGVDFLNRSRVPFVLEDKVRLFSVRELRQAFESGILLATTPTFNLLAATKGAWENDWILSAEKTWLAQYVPKTPAIG